MYTKKTACFELRLAITGKPGTQQKKHQPYLANIENNPLVRFLFFAVDKQCCAQTSYKGQNNDDAHPEVVEAAKWVSISLINGVKATESVTCTRHEPVSLT